MFGRAALVIVCTLAFAADDPPAADRAPPLPADSIGRLDFDAVPLGLVSAPEMPPDSPLTEIRVALGRRLFFDPILSADGTVSCATCHQPEYGFSSPEPVSAGVEGRRGPRTAPSLFNRAYGRAFSWDGRVATLEEQVLLPIENPDELGSTVAAALARIAESPELVAGFAAAFAEEEDAPALRAENLARALASFVRALRLGDSPVDRFIAGDVESLSNAARQGLWIFESRGGCWRCHSGPNFADERFHDTGIAHAQAEPDPGRESATEDPADRHRFKTPTLRGVARTAPYMHDGSLATLRDVVLHYSRGGNRDAPGLSPHLRPLDLTEQEVAFLVAFLEALSPEGSEPPRD